MKKYGIILFFIFISCATVSVFDIVEPTIDESYGYTIENPICIGYWGMEKSMRATMFFISNLYTDDGNRLIWIRHASIDNPNKVMKKVLPTRYGPTAGLTEIGGLLDGYTLVAENTTDTLHLYFDIYRKGPIMSPQGLKFILPER